MPMWYCAQTQPNKEFEAQDILTHKGFETFLPCYLIKYKSRNIRRKLLFRNYIFVAMDDEVNWPIIHHAPCILRMITYSPEDKEANNQPWYMMPSPVASTAIARLHSLALSQDEIRKGGKIGKPNRVVNLITSGVYVKILRGPMQGFSVQKPIVEWTDEQMAGLRLMMFGREHKFTFYKKDLEVLDQAA